jgi:hypothetical protein
VTDITEITKCGNPSFPLSAAVSHTHQHTEASGPVLSSNVQKGFMRKKTLMLAALFAATALVATGCGGDDSSDEETPTKAAYIEQADAICTSTVKEISAIAKDLPNDIESPEVQTAISDEVVPRYQDELTELRDLTPPEGDEDTTASIYDAVEEALQKVEDDPSALDEEDTFADANQQAVDYGLEVCGS